MARDEPRDRSLLRCDLAAGRRGRGRSSDPYWPTDTPFRGGREVDPIENLGRFHYLKELFLDSSTNFRVLSAVPAEPDNQPLPVHEAALTVDTVKELAGGTQRSVMHAFVMPNRGSLGTSQSHASRNRCSCRKSST